MNNAMPTEAGTPVEMTPTEVTPAVEPAEGSGASNIPRTPVVDPNAFIIRGGKYAGN